MSSYKQLKQDQKTKDVKYEYSCKLIHSVPCKTDIRFLFIKKEIMNSESYIILDSNNKPEYKIEISNMGEIKMCLIYDMDNNLVCRVLGNKIWTSFPYEGYSKTDYYIYENNYKFYISSAFSLFKRCGITTSEPVINIEIDNKNKQLYRYFETQVVKIPTVRISRHHSDNKTILDCYNIEYTDLCLKMDAICLSVIYHMIYHKYI